MIFLIRKKSRMDSDYFELTFRFGNVELLANAGFFGGVYDDDAFHLFLGSSLAKLPQSIIERIDTVSSKAVFILQDSATVVYQKRLINQYVKKQASKKWMLTSLKNKNRGFTPAHPLYFESTNPIQKAASVVIKTFAHKCLFKSEAEEVAMDITVLK